MRKVIYPLFLVILILLGATCCTAASGEPYLIHKNQNFDNHKVGEKPTAFDWVDHDTIENELKQIAAGRNNTEIVKVKKGDNNENLAVKFNSYVDPDGVVTGFARSIFNFYPIKEKGVISFSFMADDVVSKKVCYINTNVIASRHVSYVDNNAYFPFIKVENGNVYFNGTTLIKSGISAGVWYRIDFLADVAKGSGKLYFDGACSDVTLPTGIKNISEVKFDLPTTAGSAWYIDELKIYEADGLVEDKVIDDAWNSFKESSYYSGYEFESGRAANYDYMAFLRSNGKKFSVIGTDRLSVDNHIIKLPVKIHRQDDEIMVPVRAIAESYGAEVGWDKNTGRVIVSYNGKKMEVAPGENIYYIDQKPAKLHHTVSLVDGHACMQIDVLFNFLEKEYHMENDILWFDEPADFDWHMPLDENGEELWGTGNTVLSKNIYRRILNNLLCDKPTDEDIAAAIAKFSPNNMHPRIELTRDGIAEIKAGMQSDARLAKAVNSVIENARKYVNADLAVHATSDGKRTSYTDPIKTYFTDMAFAYLMSDSEADKKIFKDGIWRQIEALDTFPDFHYQYNSALGTTTMCVGLAYAYDWISWTEEERDIIEAMCRRNVMEYALMAYNSSVRANGRDIGYGTENIPMINNAGITMLAIALYEEDPQYYSDIIRGGIRGLESAIVGAYFPKGEYIEGLSYWRYAGDFLPRVLKAIQTSMGDDFGLSSVPGVYETAKFPISMKGATTGYGFGDASQENAVIPLFMFCAEQTNNKDLAQYRKEQMGNTGTTVDIVNWVYDTEDSTAGLDSYDDDVFSESNSTVIMKTGWGSADTTVAFHGGANNDPHGHFDSGSVQFDMNGVRFGTDLPREDYNVRSTGFYNKDGAAMYYPDGYLFENGHFYRQKGEGHNVVVANRSVANTKEPTSPESFDMKPDGKSEFIKMEFGETSSYALLNMTDTNDVFDCAIRGVKLDKINKRIEIQDDMKSSKKTDFLWSMHTQADIDISDDGKTAILTQNNCKVRATIINDCGFRFEELPAEFDTTYGSINKPKIETPNTVYTKEDDFYLNYGVECEITLEYRKLAVRALTDRFELSVVFEPYVEGNINPAEYIPYELWENKGVKRQNLATVTVDGELFTALRPDTYNYSLDVISQEVQPPVISATAMNSDVDVTVVQAQSVPGVATILLTQKGQTVGLYSFVITPLNDTTKFHNDKQLLLHSYFVTSEPQPQNSVRNLFDGDFGTKFATNEQGGYVIMDFGSVIEGNLRLNMSCTNGDSRREFFKIEYSDDGIIWNEAFNGGNSGTTKDLEKYDIAKKARYVKVSFYGNSDSLWASVSEMFVSNE